MKHATRLLSLAAIIAALVSAWIPRDASAYCLRPQGPFKVPASGVIPVYLNTNLVSILCPKSGCTSIAQVARRATTAWTEISENTNLRFIYSGTTSQNPDINPWIEGAIHIYATTTACLDYVGKSQSHDNDGDGKVDASHIKICSRHGPGPSGNRDVIWGAGPTSETSTALYRNLQGILMHELGHALGFLHNEDPQCNQQQHSVMNAGATYPSSSFVHLYRDDILGYEALYGPVTTTSFRAYESTDGVNWTLSSTPAVPAGTRPLGRISACTSLGATVTTMHASNNPVYNTTPGSYIEGAWTFAWSILGSTVDPAGAACGDGQSKVAVWKQTNTNLDQRLDVYSATSSDRGATWGNVTKETTGAFTGGPSDPSGVGAAFDPRSGLYVMLWRTQDNYLVAKVKSPTASASQLGGLELAISDEVPSIACGPASVGPENCIVVWNDLTWDHTIRWAHASVQTGLDTKLVLSSVIMSQPILSHGTPSIAYRGGTLPWTLAIYTGQNKVFTYRKGNGLNATWGDERLITTGSKITSPGVGAAQALGKVYLYFTEFP